MPKKSYPGGFRLTLKTARALAVQEFGTARRWIYGGGAEPCHRLIDEIWNKT